MSLIVQHAPLAFDVSAKAVICTSDQVLLLRRPNGRWDLPGGEVRRDEQVVEGLLREVREETGLSLGPLYRLPAIRRQRSNGRRCIVVFFQSLLMDAPAISLSSEHQAFAYFGFDDVAHLRLRAHHKRAVKDAVWSLYPPAHQLMWAHSQMTAA